MNLMTDWGAFKQPPRLPSVGVDGTSFLCIWNMLFVHAWPGQLLLPPFSRCPAIGSGGGLGIIPAHRVAKDGHFVSAEVPQG
jgi:hypothetical protein